MADIAAAGGRETRATDDANAVDEPPPAKKQPRLDGFDMSFHDIESSDLSSHMKEKLYVSFGSNDDFDDEASLTADQLYEKMKKDATRQDEGDDVAQNGSFANTSNETSTSTLQSLGSSCTSIHPGPRAHAASSATSKKTMHLHLHPEQIVVVKKHPTIYSNMSFLCRLRIALMQPRIARIFCWAPDGSTFLVVDRDAFRRTVLPEFFTQTTIPAFRKQLNRYDFERVHTMDLVKYVQTAFGVSDFMAWSHPFFMRDDDTLQSLIHVKAVSKTSRSRKRSPPTDNYAEL